MWMIEGVESARTKHAVHVWAYVLMPEQVHLLVRPTHRDYSISAILKTMKQAVSRRAITYVTCNTPWFLSEMADQQPSGVVTHRFWQRGGGYDSNLTEPHSVWAAMDYIHGNPVRRGFCASPWDWAWSSFREWEQPGTGPMRIDRESVPRTEAG